MLGTTNVTKEYIMHPSHISAFYLVLLTLLGSACIYIGWDSINGVPLFQFALVTGGILLGHVLTEALNENEVDE
jgi:hypothetical protein